jgi:hypothetical protein
LFWAQTTTDAPVEELAFATVEIAAGGEFGRRDR